MTMTMQNVFERLDSIGRESEKLIEDTGFDLYDGLWENVRHLPDACDDAFFRHKAEEILGYLSGISRELRYLGKPTHGEHTLEKLPNGRYGYPDAGNGFRTFTSGSCLEAKVCDVCGDYRWVESSIEHNGEDYYLVGFNDLPLEGLAVRERW